jgi:hypothetical protein
VPATPHAYTHITVLPEGWTVALASAINDDGGWWDTAGLPPGSGGDLWQRRNGG